MLVDVEVAGDVAGNVDQRMARELLDHVIEEADAGGDIELAGAIEVDRDVDGGLVGLAGDAGFTHDAAL